MKKDADHLILGITVIKNDLLWRNKKHLYPSAVDGDVGGLVLVILISKNAMQMQT